ncbi:MAG: hypothetical protein KDF65_02260, partial [Anaerolineae bacterium]|nr:hypothetical protein [Anaerolineae bacterium]
NWGGYCKHVGAVLLKWVQSPSAFTQTEAKSSSPTNPDFPIEVVPVALPSPYRPKEPIFWQTSSVTDRRQAEEKQLARWLESLKVQELRAMAKKRGWSVKGTKKADITQQIIGPMTDPTEIVRAVHSLDAAHTQVFRAMTLLGNTPGGQSDALERVATHWGKLTQYKQITTYSGHLCQMGLAVSGEIEYSYPPRPDFVPRPVIRHCPPSLEPVISTSVHISADIPTANLRLADPLNFVRKVHQLILRLEQNPVPLRPPLPRPKMEKFYPVLQKWDYDPHEVAALKTHKLVSYTDQTLTVPPPERLLPAEALEPLAPLVGGPVELDFILALLTAAGVFQAGSPLTIWPEVKEQFFRQTELGQRATLARTYFMMANWSELWEVLRQQPDLRLRRSLLYGYMAPEHLQAHLTQFRNLVLRVLACLPDNRWLKMEALLPLLKTIWPRFDQSHWETSTYSYSSRQNPGWYLARRNVDQPLRSDNAADWHLAQWNFIVQLITGPLHWLGLVDLYENNGRPVEIRLHGLADLYWDRVEVPDAPHPTLSQSTTAAPSEAVTIEGETITINPAAVGTQVHSLLDKIARLDEVLPDRFIYALSVQAVHAAFEAGCTLVEIVAEWQELMPQPLPDHLRARLEAWWQGYGQVRLYENVTVIEFDDDYALAEMKAVTSLTEQLIAEISPRLVLIPADAVDSLTAELEKAGYTPKQTDQV